MAKRLMADGKTGKVCIMEGGSRSVFENPRDNLNKVHFHSDLDYLTIVQQMTIAGLSMPAVAKKFDAYTVDSKKGKGSDTYYVPHFQSGTRYYNLGTLVGDPDGPILGFMGNQPLASFPLFWRTSGDYNAFRTVSLVRRGSEVWLSENWMNLGLDIPEQTIADIKIVKFNLMSDSNPNSNYKLMIKPDRFIASGGKLDSAARYVKKMDAGAPFAMYYGRTMDCSNGGGRWWTANGTPIDENGYDGDYIAPPPIGITV